MLSGGGNFNFSLGVKISEERVAVNKNSAFKLALVVLSWKLITGTFFVFFGNYRRLETKICSGIVTYIWI